jgi:DNA repair protein RadC
MHEGHRERLISKLIEGNTLLSDHEVLEILLFYSIPRKNVNELAHKLITTFGSLSNCLNADYNSLMSVDGVGHKTATFLVTLSEIQSRIRMQNNNLPSIFSFDSCKQLLINSFRGLKEEKFGALFLDKQGKIIYRKLFSSHSDFSVTVDVAELLKGVLSRKPHSVILCHNHISGNPTPSEIDDKSTQKIYTILKLNDIALYDHIIVSDDKAYSYRVYDRLDDIKKKVDQNIE